MDYTKYYEDGGRPPMYESADDLMEAVAEYFNNPPKKPKRIDGELIEIPFVSITGLALHLGYESRQSFYDNEKKPEFSYILKRARTFIENHYEFELQNGNTTGAIFALKQFGWTDKIETDNLHTHDLSGLTDAELEAIANGSKA